MLVLATIAAVTVAAGVSAWWVFDRWSPDLTAPRIRPEAIESEVRAHPWLRAWLRARAEPDALTGVILSAAVIIAVAGAVAVGVLLLMVRTHEGFATFDLSAARFGANHATPTSTSVLRLITQLGGAVVLVPMTVIFAAITGRRVTELPSICGFLLLCVGGQFAVANVIKAAVQRARPDLLHLTGFSGSSFPSGHATAAAATFAAMALIAGRGRARSTRAVMGGAAVGLTAMVAASRVLLGVHWLTDSLAGMCLGWSWFALCSIAFGGRLLRYGASTRIAQEAAQPQQESRTEEPASR